MTAAAAVLSHFPEDLIIEATSPDGGMQVLAFKKFPPNVGEIRSYCDALLASPRYRAKTEALASFQGRTYQGTPVEVSTWNGHPLTSRQIQQLLDREAFENEKRDRSSRKSYDELKARYGENWGIAQPAKKPETWKSPSWDEVAEFYKNNPERWQRLVRERDPGLR